MSDVYQIITERVIALRRGAGATAPAEPSKQATVSRHQCHALRRDLFRFSVLAA